MNLLRSMVGVLVDTPLTKAQKAFNSTDHNNIVEFEMAKKKLDNETTIYNYNILHGYITPDERLTPSGIAEATKDFQLKFDVMVAKNMHRDIFNKINHKRASFGPEKFADEEICNSLRNVGKELEYPTPKFNRSKTMEIRSAEILDEKNRRNRAKEAWELSQKRKLTRLYHGHTTLEIPGYASLSEGYKTYGDADEPFPFVDKVSTQFGKTKKSSRKNSTITTTKKSVKKRKRSHKKSRRQGSRKMKKSALSQR